MVYDSATGVLLNSNLLDYHLPLANDFALPVQAKYLETGSGYGAYGCCGVGESIPSSGTTLVALAVHNALGVWIDDIPVTPEKILKALGKI